MNYYVDLNSREAIAEDRLRKEFAIMQTEDPDIYNYSFEEYIRNCTGKNGFLQTLEDAMHEAARILKYWHAERFEYVEEYKDACKAWNKLYPHDTDMGNRILKEHDLWRNGRFWY